MKPASLALLFALAIAAAGCSRAYVMKLNNGLQITTASKPRLKHGQYEFKDARGRTGAIPEGRVREILPASMAGAEKARFNPSTAR